MKKVLIVLLVIAAGAGAYYFLQNKKTEAGNAIQKELLTGNWKFNSVETKVKNSSANPIALITDPDSNFVKYRFDFRTDGNILKTIADSVKADTARYEWTKKDELVWKKNLADSAGEILTVTKLNRDSLLLQSKDSMVFLFTKLK